MSKRKYIFKTRLDAEKSYLNESLNSTHRYRAMLALYTKSVRWLAKKGSYRVGLFDEDSPAGSRVLLVFQTRGQAPSLTAADAFEWSSEMIQHYNRLPPSPNDSEGCILRDFAYLVRQEINKSLTGAKNV